MLDIQGRADTRRVRLQNVGVKHVLLPMTVLQRDGGGQTVQARVQVSVDLPHHAKGTHMSRFIEALEHWKSEPLSGGRLADLLDDVRICPSARTMPAPGWRWPSRTS